MSTLGCSAYNCVNNEGGMCGASYILVEGEGAYTSAQTYCKTFEQKNLGNSFKAMGNTNFVGELVQMFTEKDRIKMNPVISCHATKCFYNGEGKCEARNLIIIGNNPKQNIDTRCETFIESY